MLHVALLILLLITKKCAIYNSSPLRRALLTPTFLVFLLQSTVDGTIHSSYSDNLSLPAYSIYIKAITLICFQTLASPRLLLASFHACRLTFQFATCLYRFNAVSTSIIILHTLELCGVILQCPVWDILQFIFKRSFISIGLSAETRLAGKENQIIGNDVIDFVTDHYSTHSSSKSLIFDYSSKAFVLRSLIAHSWHCLCIVFLLESLLELAKVWKMMSLISLFSPANTGYNPIHLISAIIEQLCLHILCHAFQLQLTLIKAYYNSHAVTALYSSLCRHWALEPSSSRTPSSLLEARYNLIEPYVSMLFGIISKVSPVVGIAGNMAALYSLLQRQALLVIFTIFVFAALSEWISSMRRIHLAFRQHKKTMHSRFAQFLPSFVSFKMLTLEDVIMRIRPGDYEDNRLSSVLSTGAMSLAKFAKEAGIYLAIASTASIKEHKILKLDIVRFVSLVRIAIDSCVELVKVAGAVLELRQLEFALATKLTATQSIITQSTFGPYQRCPSICIECAVFKRIGQTAVALQVDRLNACSGQILAVTGPVGSGKTTFLMAMLSELELAAGTSCINGSIVYAGQSPWVMNATVKENILFGKPFDEKRYNRAVHACCLESDISRMTQGDQTNISDQGSNLSGGQRARIALARAVYAQAQIYILDDLLAALDANVRSAVWNRVLSPNGILRESIRIIVTDSAEYISYCDAVATMDSGIARVRFKKAKQQPKNKRKITTREHRGFTYIGGTTKVPGMASKNEDNSAELAVPQSSKITSTEWKAVAFFIHICGISTLTFAVLNGVVTYAIYALLQQRRAKSLSAESGADKMQALNSYAISSAVYTTADVLMSWVQLGIQEWIYVSLPRSRLHHALLNGIAHAKMSEIWQISESRLISIVKSAEHATSIGPHGFLADSAYYMTSIIHSIYNTATMISPVALGILVLGGVTIAYQHRQKTNVLARIQAYRMDINDTQDKIIRNLFSGSLTVRAFGVYGYFDDRILELCNLENAMEQIADAIFQTRTLCQAAIEMSVTFVLIGLMLLEASLKAMNITPAEIQNYHQTLSNSLPLIRYFLDFEHTSYNHMTAMRHFSETANLKPEETLLTMSCEQSVQKWLQHGRIEFKDCSMRYKSGDNMALNRVSFDVEPGSHIGIVGRTGAGKSSILQTLMRITDLESGLILIDGVDIAQLPLRNLRRSIGVVPQSSALFEGTLHDNIDPFKQSSATDIEDVIETTRIKDVLGGLDSWVDNCGKNLSSGQQQLIGICRALLQNCKIFVLDEATANVDAATTKRIMSILRTKFKGCTVLIIAHRLETIESCDKILVMSDGQVVEFDTPAALKARGSQFAKLLKAGTEGASTKH